MNKLEIKSSKIDFERFAKGDLWKDMLNVLEDKLHNDLLQRLVLERDQVTMYQIQGAIEELKDLMHLPEIIVESLVEEEENEDE